MKTTTNNKQLDIGLLLLRLSTGGLLLFHGFAKLSHGHDFIKGMLAEKGLPQFIWLGVPLTEVIAPVFLILGMLSRMAGASIAILMALTVILAHMPNAFTITQTGGLEIELNLLYLFGALTICFMGAGRIAVYKPKRIWLQ